MHSLRPRRLSLLLVLLLLGLATVGGARWKGRAPPAEVVVPPLIPPTAAAKDGASTALSASFLVERAAEERRWTLERLAYAQAWDGPQPAAFRPFRDWAERYRAASATERTTLETDGVELARARRPEMVRLITRDPQRAIALTVPASLRQLLPAVVLAELESRVAGRGDFTLTAATYDSNETPGPAMRRRAFLGGVTYTAYAYGRRESQLTEEGASLHGIALDGKLALHESPLRVLDPGEIPGAGVAPLCPVSAETIPPVPSRTAVNLAALDVVEAEGRVMEFCNGEAMLQKLEQRLTTAEDVAGPEVQPLSFNPGESLPPLSSAEAATALTVGVKAVIVIRVDFSDVPGEPITAPAAQSVMDTGVGPFFETMSYGLTSLVTTVSSKVYRLPQTGSAYALADNEAQLHSDARALAGADYNVASFDRIIVIFPNIGTSRFAGSKITFGGEASIAGSNVWINGSASFTLATVSHELGHTYGLLHSNLWKVNDGNPVSAAGTSLEYGDPFDDLGSSSVTGVARDSRHHFNPWFKNRLGWIPDSAVTSVTTSGIYRVYRFDSKTPAAAQPLALRIFRDGVRSYWVGLRQNFASGSPSANDAYVLWGFNNRQQSALLDLNTPGVNANDATLALGSTFTDPVYNLSIKPVARGGSEPAQWLDVEVTFPPTPSSVVAAWGKDGAYFFSGNTGTPTMPVPETYVPFGLSGVQAFAGGDVHALVLRANGSLVAWGDDTYGQSTVPAGLSGNVTAIAAGGNVSGVVKRDGTVQLWGDATFAQTSAPADLTGVRQLAIGRNHAIALKSDGTVVGWGSNTVGQRTTPAGLADVIAIAAGTEFSAALKRDGTVVAWGSSLVRTVPASLSGVVAISACGALNGGQFINALKSDGTVVAWGANNLNQATVPAGLNNVIGVAAGAFHSIALKSDGSVVGWGSNTNGQLNVPASLPRSYLVATTARASFAVAGPGAEITVQPPTQFAAIGGGIRLYVEATGSGVLSYQWRKNGLAISGASGSTLTLTGLSAADASKYDVVVTDLGSGSTVTSAAATLTLVPAGDPGRLVNLSILTTVSASSPLFTVGTVIGGSGTSGNKPLLIRAAGPALATLGVSGVLADPKLDVFSDQNTVAAVASNDNWSGTDALTAAFARVGAFAYGAANSKDAAVYETLPAGGYTVQVSGVGAVTGTVIAELYDATPAGAFTASTPRLINVSVLKQIASGEILTVGFVVGGTTSKQVLVRAIGPTLALAPFNVGGVMTDPKLDLFSGQTVIRSNNNWGGSALLSSTGSSVGAFSVGDSSSKDAILLATLAPGAYTVQVSGANSTSGLALVEVYEVP